MIELKLEVDGENKHINLRDFYYEIHDEGRGIREKFWIKREKGRLISENIKDTEMLFKINRNNQSCEDWGEIFASRIGKAMKMNIVDYYMAEFDDGEKKVPGVLCGSFFVSDKQYEMSGHALQTIYTNCSINYDTNETDKPLNTVYSFLDDLEEIIDFPEEQKQQAITTIKRELLFQCLFDYLLAQSDRHWLNTSFLVYEKNGQVDIIKSACYDNGCIALLKRKFSAIQGITREVGDDPLNSEIFKYMMEKYIPMFGVKSSTVKLIPSHTGEIGTKLKVDLTQKEKFIDELTDEILYNPDMAVFYTKFKNDLSFKKILNSIRIEGDEPPEEVINMILNVVTYQVDSLEKVLQKKLTAIRAQEGR